MNMINPNSVNGAYSIFRISKNDNIWGLNRQMKNIFACGAYALL